jgi:Na+/proline symporter
MNAGPGVVLFVVSGLLLTSIGGLGIIAAPITLPLMALVVWRRPTRAFRIAGALIGSLTAAELAWALVYITAGEVRPLIWLAPAAAALVIAVLFLRMGLRRRSPGGAPPPSTAPAGR